jgi:hypothetical protein
VLIAIVGSGLLPACSPVRAPELGDSVHILRRMLPGSVKVLATAELASRYPFRGLPDGTVGVAERHAGARAVACARRVFAVPITPYPAPRTVAAFDCYHSTPGLRLRRIDTAPDAAPLFTFTGGSGGGTKTALAASRVAATALPQPRRAEVVR